MPRKLRASLMRLPGRLALQRTRTAPNTTPITIGNRDGMIVAADVARRMPDAGCRMPDAGCLAMIREEKQDDHE